MVFCIAVSGAEITVEAASEAEMLSTETFAVDAVFTEVTETVCEDEAVITAELVSVPLDTEVCDLSV